MRATTFFLLTMLSAGTVPAQPVYPFPQALPDFVRYGALPPSHALPDGKRLLGGAWTRGPAVARVNADGSLDATFGDAGLARLVAWGVSQEEASVFAALPDGRVVVASMVKDHSHVPGCAYYYQDCNLHTVIFRLDADGRQDRAFNGYGRIVLRIGGPTPGTGHTEDAGEHFVDTLRVEPGGKVVVSSVTYDGHQISSLDIARLHPDGRFDTTFKAPNPAFAAREHDFIGATPFYDAIADRHFVATDIPEIATLPTSWQGRDGGFHVYPAGWESADAVPVCRLYRIPASGQGSHVLSAHAPECVALEAGSPSNGWILETREAFRASLPDPATGACPSDRVGVYRLWNGRVDADHVLTTSWYERNALLARGYVSEGWGPEGVAMCSAPW